MKKSILAGPALAGIMTLAACGGGTDAPGEDNQPRPQGNAGNIVTTISAELAVCEAYARVNDAGEKSYYALIRHPNAQVIHNEGEPPTGEGVIAVSGGKMKISSTGLYRGGMNFSDASGAPKVLSLNTAAHTCRFENFQTDPNTQLPEDRVYWLRQFDDEQYDVPTVTASGP